MKEERIIQTNTKVTTVGNTLDIYTYFVSSLNSLVAFVPAVSNFVNRVFFKENELGFNSSYDDVELSINNLGELIIKSNSDKNFTVNSDGELIMEEPD